MKDIFALIALLAVFMFATMLLNDFANDRAQARCEAQGFTYARAAFVAESLCIRKLEK